uniref:Uncharacterized protein n=1 Tax=Tanacetum cinerariifolium TaxID=118510 RepID=A0A6L2N4F0_TANCI|nr:hypothetical protein [Tanacetum cinerariifolium]
MVIDSGTTLERTYHRWLSWNSIPSPRTNEFWDWVILSDPKQALCGRQSMLILVVVMNKCCCVEARLFHFSCFVVLFLSKNSRILKTRACGFLLRSLDLHILNFILGIQYPNLIE